MTNEEDTQVKQVRPVRGFAVGGINKTTIHVHEMSDSSIGIVLSTEREGKEPMQTNMRLSAETFGLLSHAMFLAAHDPNVWMPVKKQEEEMKSISKGEQE